MQKNERKKYTIYLPYFVFFQKHKIKENSYLIIHFPKRMGHNLKGKQLWKMQKYFYKVKKYLNKKQLDYLLCSQTGRWPENERLIYIRKKEDMMKTIPVIDKKP